METKDTTTKDAPPIPDEEPSQKEAAGPDVAATSNNNILTDLCILSPRQKRDADIPTHRLALPPLRNSEPVQSLRGALTEIVGYTHITCFHFEVEPPTQPAVPEQQPQGNGTPSPEQQDLPLLSPYTGTNAAIVVPANTTTTPPPLLLDDYGDLRQVEMSGTAFRMVLEPYTALAVEEHVTRIRSLLAGNAPANRVIYPTTSTAKKDISKEPAASSEGKKKKSGAADKNNSNDSSSKNSNNPQQLINKPLPELKETEEVAVDMTNLGDFFYLAWGEDPMTASCNKKNKKKQGRKDETARWNELEETCQVKCTILPSGYHPPSTQRKMVGDIAYFDVTCPDGAVVCVTACRMGFYVNGSKVPNVLFNPAPATDHCYSHSLLDCLIQASDSFSNAWTAALAAAKERSEIVERMAPYSHYLYSHIRGDYPGFKHAALAQATTRVDLSASSWLVPVPRKFQDNPTAWTRNQYHSWDPHRALESLQNSHGIDLRGGGCRDWNEELQMAREMPTTTHQDRVERARLLYKVQSEFAEASLASVYAIAHGHILPMNPIEGPRSHVYLHNNIFVSRAIDTGEESFKLVRGDAAARKVANRDVQCIGTLSRLVEQQTGVLDDCDAVAVATMATIVVEYWGMRYVCQSVLPGILSGERSHKMVYGSVETANSLLNSEELQKQLEEPLRNNMRIAKRSVLRRPLLSSPDEGSTATDAASSAPDSFSTCLPVEAKGIRGSDRRTYLLDIHRLTPRDANWIPTSAGGTGKIDSMNEWDEESAMCVIRPELVNHFIQFKLSHRIAARRKDVKDEKKVDGDSTQQESSNNGTKRKNRNEIAPEKCSEPDEVSSTVEESQQEDADATDKVEKQRVTEEDRAYADSLQFNLNCFLPNTKSFDSDEKMSLERQQDEQLIRELASFLWDEVLPRVTRAVKDSQIAQIPVDGKSLTEFLHRNGINCRYLGRLAQLAKEQEDRDRRVTKCISTGERTIVDRKIMPEFWLELLECEMVARSAKHLLDEYMLENEGLTATQPAQTVASFLSALVSESDESAGQTEIRLRKQNGPDEDDFGSITIADVLGDVQTASPSNIRTRREVWSEITKDVLRRFRYELQLFNTGTKSPRALYASLLRRVCQRSGIKLVARNYDLGGNCHGGGTNISTARLVISYPISPLDVVDIVPMMKHSAAYNEGFVPCRLGTDGRSSVLPPLHVALHEARAVLERAHIQFNAGAYGKALELAQDASSLYARVADHHIHPGVVESTELLAKVMFEAGNPELAAVNQGKMIAMNVQNDGIDSHTMITSHITMFQMLFNAREMELAVKHMRAAAYLLELLAGSRHCEIYSAYHKIGTIYAFPDYDDKYLRTALCYYNEARKRGSSDRLLDGCMAKTTAKILEQLGQFKEAIDDEKKAFAILQLFLGKDHQMTIESDQNLKRQTKLAVETANKELAEAAQNEILASRKENVDEEKRKKKPKKKKGKGKVSGAKS